MPRQGGAYMRYHHNTVLGEREVQLNGISARFDRAFECRQRVLGIVALEASVADYLGAWWCIIVVDWGV